MADGVAITAGSGTTIATDDCGASGHAQILKLAVSTDGAATLVGADTSGLYVRPAAFTTRLTATSSGLTTATTAYVAGDQLGAQLSFANAVRVSGGTGIIRGVRLLDKADVTGNVDVLFFRSSVTPAADNAAAAWSDSDMDSWIGTVNLSMIDYGNNRGGVSACYLPFDCSATTLYACMVTRTGHTFFGAATDLVLALYIQQD